jgi:RNA polymerase sigma factor (sigma-70 family)
MNGKPSFFANDLLTAIDASAEGASDALLLRRFAESRDEKAFEQLVWRHGLLVLNVCRRVLRHEHDTEDAFQATFLALARKAAAICKHRAVASWLYKVALRVALRARAQAARRHEQRLTGCEPLCTEAASDGEWQDLRSLVDEEVNRLPEKYRIPFILCGLEGLSNHEAARQIGCPEGTVRSRLARARVRLRCRLMRRGVGDSAGLLAAATASVTMWAASPVALVRSTTKAAIAFATGSVAASEQISSQVLNLTEGVLRTMFPTKLTVALTLLLVIVVGAGGLVARHFHEPLRGSDKASSSDNKPRDPGDWKLKSTFLADKMTHLNAVALSPDGKLLATAHDDKGVQLWDIAEGKEKDTLLKGIPEQVRALAFSPDGTTVAAAASNDIYRWNVATGKSRPAIAQSQGDPVEKKKFKFLALAFAPDEKHVAVGGTGFGCGITDLTDANASVSFIHARETRAIAYSPDGKTLVLAGLPLTGRALSDRTLPAIRLWDAEASAYGAELSNHEAGFNCIAFSADGKMLAAGSPDKTVQLFTLGEGEVKEPTTLKGHEDEVCGVAFAPKGNLLASCGSDETVRIWDTQTHKLLATLEGHKKLVRLVRFSADGKTLTSVDDEGVVKVWETK